MAERDFTNRIDFLTPVAGMVVWTGHFTLLWVASIVLPGEPAARWIAYAVTLGAFAALFWLWRRAGRPPLASVPGLGLAIATAGTVYDVLPALIG